jgi:hypothetical protein
MQALIREDEASCCAASCTIVERRWSTVWSEAYHKLPPPQKEHLKVVSIKDSLLQIIPSCALPEAFKLSECGPIHEGTLGLPRNENNLNEIVCGKRLLQLAAKW